MKALLIEKKAALKEQGLSGKKIDKDPEIAELVVKLTELKKVCVFLFFCNLSFG